MKKISLLVLSFVFMFGLGLTAKAQPGAQPATPKIGWIDTGMFEDEKDGIRRYVTAMKSLETEMRPRLLELQTIAGKIGTIQDDLKKMTSNSAVPVNQQTVAAKQEEGQRLQREGEFKQKEYDATLEKRSNELLGPIRQDIGKALTEFAKNKGYSVVLDANKLFQAGVILTYDGTADVTKEFITFFNARPATTASTTTATPPARP